MRDRVRQARKSTIFRRNNAVLQRKTCSGCKCDLPKSMFYKRKDGKVSHMCRHCLSIQSYMKRRDKQKYAYSVYVIRIDNTPYYKIGKTHDIDYRLETLRYHNPMPISVLLNHECDDAGLLELKLHKVYEQFRVWGEWYRMVNFSIDDIKAAIKRLSI